MFTITNIVFAIQMCNEWNKTIFCFKNQWMRFWLDIDIFNMWRQREYRNSDCSSLYQMKLENNARE